MTRAYKASALVAVAAFGVSTLAACSTHPGQAASVGSQDIAQSRVADVAEALCAAQTTSQQAGASAQALSSRAALSGALSVLVETSLSKQYGDSQGATADRQQISSLLDSRAQLISALPTASRSTFRDVLRQSAQGQLMLIDIGKKRLDSAGQTGATAQQAFTAGTQLRNAWVAKHLDVSVNPRYGSFSNGTLAAGSGSLSVPVSSSAVAGAKAQPSTSWVAGLPANQKCS